jgi:hypothetical protein
LKTVVLQASNQDVAIVGQIVDDQDPAFHCLRDGHARSLTG